MESLKEKWETLPSKMKKTIVLMVSIMALVIIIWIAASSKAKSNKEILVKENQKAKTDLFLVDDGNADIETLSSKIRTLEDELRNEKEDREDLEKTIFDLNVKIKEIEDINGDPEVIKRIAEETDKVRKDLKKLDDQVKNRFAKGVVVNQEGVTTETIDGEIVAVTSETGLEGGEFDIFGETSSNTGVDSDNQIDVIAGNRAAKVNRSDARDALINTAESGKRPLEGYDGEEGVEKSFGIHFSNEQKVESNAEIEMEKRKMASNKNDISRDVVAVESKKRSEAIYIPSGSMFTGFLMNGIDAPTGDEAKAHPVPVTIRVNSQAIMPNNYQFDIRECFVTAAAYGNASSERAEIRTERISCVWGEDQMIDFPVDGYVTGEDGKVGLRGTLVTKQGKLLYNSAIAGALGGFSEAMKPQRVNSVRTGGNAGDIEYDAPPADQVIGTGAQAGLSKSSERIADFYLEKAEQLVPIIEIDAMREVTVIINKGVRLESQDLAAKKVSRTKNKKRTK